MENKPASLLVVPLGKALSGIPPSWCGTQVWLATPKRARTALRSLFRDRRIYMQLNTRNTFCFRKKFTYAFVMNRSGMVLNKKEFHNKESTTNLNSLPTNHSSYVTVAEDAITIYPGLAGLMMGEWLA